MVTLICQSVDPGKTCYTRDRTNLSHMVNELIAAARPKMEAALAHFQAELKTLRLGRANVQMLDGVMVQAYGSMAPLKSVASVTTPEASQLMVQPFDAGMLRDIRQAIVDADLGFNPSDDGRALRIVIPPLTAERREELVKHVGKLAEECRISIRTIRGEAWEKIQKLQKEGEITEPERDNGRIDIDALTDEFNKKVEAAAKEKEADIRTV